MWSVGPIFFFLSIVILVKEFLGNIRISNIILRPNDRNGKVYV